MSPVDTNEKGGSAAEIWDRLAHAYDAERQNDPVYRSCVHQAVSSVSRRTAIGLDAGCGTGLTTAALHSRCDLVVAVDYSFESIKALNRKQIRNVLGVQADLRMLPFADSLFDASVCANTLQHLRPGSPQRSAIAELRRVTRDDGLLSLSVHHYSRRKRSDGWIKEGKPGQAGVDYIFRFAPSDLRALLPGAVVRAVGYYGLLKIPVLGSRLQDCAARAFGRLAALLGCGHMLVAVLRNRKRETEYPDPEPVPRPGGIAT